MILVTGGAGFIGSNFVLEWVLGGFGGVVNLDRLTYAGNMSNLDALGGDPRHVFEFGDVGDEALVARVLSERGVSAVVHFAAESHVDRSIRGPRDFVSTNIVGTFGLLEACRSYWAGLSGAARDSFRFVHVSTDEVYGSLGPEDSPFTESSPHRPNSPYAASKAAADHLVRSYHRTYGFPAATTNCSNNYGPFQFPEKLIPLVVHRALEGSDIPVYGDGMQVRDWLYVGDHCAALRRVLEAGVPGEVYNIGGGSEVTNIDVVRSICSILDEERPLAGGRSYASQISHVGDRPGHDRRYAVDAGKIGRELGWSASETFGMGLRRTVRWYLSNRAWVEAVANGSYRDWIGEQYGGSDANSSEPSV